MTTDIYAAEGRSLPQRVLLTAAGGVSLGLAWWILLGTGIERLTPWRAGNESRRICLAVALTIYLLRLLATQFVFLKRAVGWGEAGAIAPWLLLLYVAYALAGGTNSAAAGVAAVGGGILFVLGSWMNSYAELARDRWKRRPGNRGKLYTLGLFRYARHPNYLGDVISFTGLSVLTGRWETTFIPLAILAGFILVNIPMLDAHLHDHYGAAFDEYAMRTRKLIPFVY